MQILNESAGIELESRTAWGGEMLSYSRGPDQPLWEKTIGQVLNETVERSGDCLALVSRHQSKRYTWRELREQADRFARGLWSLGIRPGDRVGLWSTNCVEWVVVHLGCARAGAILVNVNPAYRTHELAYTLRKSRMKGSLPLGARRPRRVRSNSCRSPAGSDPST